MSEATVWPVMSSICSIAWPTSRSRPLTTAQPACSAVVAENGRPRIVDDINDHGRAVGHSMRNRVGGARDDRRNGKVGIGKPH